MEPAAPLVLASESAIRLALLHAAGVACVGRRPTVDEALIQDDDPRRLAARRADAKARSLYTGEAWVIGADQVAWLDDAGGRACFGKPRDPVDHAARLRTLRGRRHTLTTGVTLLHPNGEVRLSVDSILLFRGDISDEEIGQYVATREGSGCAGGYAVEGLGGQLVERIEGDCPNVLGLPIYAVIGALRALGWRPRYPLPAAPDDMLRRP